MHPERAPFYPGPGHPLLCLVTDRRRLRIGDRHTRLDAALVASVREAAAAGVDIVQVRERDLEAAQLADIVTAILEATRGSQTRVVVNDRVDVAVAAGAHGVHLRHDSIPPTAARTLAPPGFLIGRSVHSIEEAREDATAVDYLIAGTVFPTASKPTTDRFLNPGGLRQIVEAVSVPVLAIGGITEDRIAAIAATGAAGFAAIGLFLENARPLSEVVRAAHERFDSARARF